MSVVAAVEMKIFALLAQAAATLPATAPATAPATLPTTMPAEPQYDPGTLLVVVLGNFAFLLVICGVLFAALRTIPPGHRKMHPALVWLLIVPLFGLFWNFYVFINVAESFRAYFQSRGRDVGDAGRTLGFATALVWLSVICLKIIAVVPTVILVVIYLVKVIRMTREVRAMEKATS